VWNIFEQPWTLLVTGAVLLLVVAVVNSFIQAKSKRRLWLIPLLVAALGPALDFAVRTDREKIEKVIDTGVKAIENEDCRAIAAIIAENYSDSIHPNKSDFMRRCRAILQPPLVDKVYDSILNMQISGNTASVTMLSRIFFDEQSEAASYAKLVLVKVEINLKKGTNGNWLVTQAEILAVNGRPSKWSEAGYPNW
jgi:ketosteroid isomerase-like protein